MATSGSSGLIGIQEKDLHFMRVLKALTSQGSFTLRQVLKWGCPAKTDLQTYKEYLIDSVMTNTVYKKTFDKQQQQKILSNRSGDEFDISLLFKIIQWACHSLAPFGDDAWTVSDDTKLEYLLISIKKERNNLMHDLPSFTQDTMIDKIESLRETFKNVIQNSGTLYSVNTGTVNNLLRHIDSQITKIRDQPFADPYSCLKEYLYNYGPQELKQKYGSKTLFNPLYFLDKHKCHLKVATVFVRPEIEYNKDERPTNFVPFTDLLEHLNTTTPNSTTPDSLMILEGQPGVGKTTLLKFYVDEWIAGGGSIKGLSQYDLVLHFECRDTSIDSLTKLLRSHMPKTASKIPENYLVHILLNLKVMVLVDGVDELNEASQKALKEILDIKSSPDFTLICTSRPEKIPDLQKMVSNRNEIVKMIIQGIPKQEREKFVQEYHNELKQHGVITGQDINGLLEYLRKVPPHLQDFLKYPLNLVMLIFLWDDPNSRVRDITSTTALYLETHKLLIEKLHDRLMNQPSMKHMLTNLKTKCETFLAYMNMEALRSQAHDVVFLDKGQIKKLKKVCESLDIPAQEIFSAFLVSASNDQSLTHSERVKFPHKSLQDFHAANFLTFLLEENLEPDDSMYNRMRYDSVHPSKENIWKHIQETLGQSFSIRSILVMFNKDQTKTQDFSKYRNIILQLVYLLHKSDPNTVAHYAEEIVTPWAAGEHMNFQHCADLLKESKYNPTLAQNISEVLDMDEWVVEYQHVKAAVVWLPHNCPSILDIKIINDPKDVPDLHDLLVTVAATHNCRIIIDFYHHWKYPESGLSNSLLQKLEPLRDCIRSTADIVSDDPRSRIVEIIGHFNGEAINMLPTSLQKLHMVIADDQDARDWFETLPKLSQTLPRLKHIVIHITPAVSPNLLPELPQFTFPNDLTLSNVGDDNISWACEVSRALVPPNKGYRYVELMHSSVSSDGVKQLAEHLCRVGVDVYWLTVDSPHIHNLSDSDYKRLQTIFEYKFGCYFDRVII